MKSLQSSRLDFSVMPATTARSGADVFEILAGLCLVAGLATAGISSAHRYFDGTVLGIGIIGGGLAFFATAEALRRLADISASARISAARSTVGE
jgi:hypothetical protein